MKELGKAIIAIILIIPAYIADKIQEIYNKKRYRHINYNDGPMAKGHNI